MNTINQHQLVTNFMSKNPNRQLTTEQVVEYLNKDLKRNNRLTIPQVSACLSRLKANNLVTRYDFDGTDSAGRKVSKWGWRSSRKKS